MKRDISTFIDKCLHCLVSKSGSLIPRPLAHALHGSRPNEVLHFDFLYMGPGQDNNHYVLIVKDDLSAYTWLFPTVDCNAEAAAESISSWVAAFGAPEWFVSDQGTHFKNRLMTMICRELRTKHHFTTAYSPWSNGTVERVCREILRVARALCSEWKLAPQDWPAVLEVIQSVLNMTPLKRLGTSQKTGNYRSPLEVFTGQIAQRPLLRALPPSQHENAVSMDEAYIRQEMLIDDLLQCIDEMHKNVEMQNIENRRRQIRAHNKKTGIQEINFEVGDFVLVRAVRKQQHKLSFNWVGPRRIIRTSGHCTFIVENIINGKTETVHARRIMKYNVKFDGKDVPLDIIESAKHNEETYEIVEKLHDAKLVEGEIKILVEWQGLPDKQDWTWENAENLHIDVPDLLRELAEHLPTTNTVQRALLAMTTV